MQYKFQVSAFGEQRRLGNKIKIKDKGMTRKMIHEWRNKRKRRQIYSKIEI